MKKSKVLLVLGTLFSFTVMAGHISVDNHTNDSIKAQCGHHGDQGYTNHIEPGHRETMEVHGDHHGQAYCQALDHHGNVLTSRNFDFHHGNESYSWEISHTKHY